MKMTPVAYKRKLADGRIREWEIRNWRNPVPFFIGYKDGSQGVVSVGWY